MIAIARTYAFAAPRERVWQLLMDTNALALCIPGCRSLDPDPDTTNRYRISLSVKLAAVMGTYDGTVELVDLTPQQSYGLVAEGKGRPGFVKGKASISLDAAPDTPTTTLTVAGEVQAGGAIARVGQRLLTSAARMMMDRFFKRLKTLAEAESHAEFDVARLEAAEVDSAEQYFDTPADES